MLPRLSRNVARYARLRLESLEDRLALYSASGNLWANPQLVTLSFVPDGTVVGYNASGAILSNFEATMDGLFGDPSIWKPEILRAAQVWAKSANLNFAVVSDDGTPIGGGLYQQGASNFGDIRIGGYDFGTSTLAQAYLPPNVNNYSIAGDIQFNTGQSWNVGADYDLFTVATHEIGHALGLYHSSTITASMYSAYTSAKADLDADDVAGVQAVYGGARSHDSYDAAASNNTAATAKDLTSQINATSKTATINGMDLTSTSDVDWYRFTAPSGTTGTLVATVQSNGLSLLTPKVQLYASNGSTLLTTATGVGDYDGATVTLTRTGITAGTVYFLKVSGAETQTGGWSAFNTGKYGLTLKFASTAPTALTLPNTQVANGNPLQGGGGQAIAFQPQFRANAATGNAQFTSVASGQAVAMDANGNYVAVWTSDGQDGDGFGVYAQRFNAAGVKQGAEFRVNNTTANSQTEAAVAMDNAGNFVVSWTSDGQDGSGYGIYAQRFNAAGVKQGAEFRVNTTTDDDQSASSVAMDADGDFIVTWSHYGSDADVYMQRFNAAGNKQGGEVRVNTTTSNGQDYSRVAADDAGNFVIVWSSYGQDGSGFGIYAQRFDAAGNKQGGEFRVSTTTANDQDYSSVAMDGDGDFVVTWTGYTSSTYGYDVFAQRYNAAGVALGGEARVNDVPLGDQMHSSVAMDDQGNILFTWQSWNALTGLDIYAQQMTSSGARQGLSLVVNPSTLTGDQRYASVAMSDHGRAVVLWSGAGNGDVDGVFGQLYLINQGNGMSNMEAQPHGFGPDGCADGCGHDHHHHEEESDDHGCGCATCATAVYEARSEAGPASGSMLMFDWAGLMAGRESVWGEAPARRGESAPAPGGLELTGAELDEALWARLDELTGGEEAEQTSDEAAEEGDALAFFWHFNW